jgi:hypothetical protein
MTQRSLRNRPMSMRQMAAFRKQEKYANANFGRDDRNPNYLGYGAAAGVGGLGLRYGGAELNTRLAQRTLNQNTMSSPIEARGQSVDINTQRRAMSRGARGQLGRDLDNLGQGFRNAGRSVGQGFQNLQTDAGRVGKSIQDDFGQIGKEFDRSVTAGRKGLEKGANLKRGTRLGAGLNSGRKFLLGTNTGRAGLAAGALGAGYAGYRALRGND